MAVVGGIILLMGLAAVIFHRPFTRFLVWAYTRHSTNYPILYPGPLKRLVKDPAFVRWIPFTVGIAWIAIGVVEVAASFD